jgi:hypothetical protein
MAMERNAEQHTALQSSIRLLPLPSESPGRLRMSHLQMEEKSDTVSGPKSILKPAERTLHHPVNIMRASSGELICVYALMIMAYASQCATILCVCPLGLNLPSVSEYLDSSHKDWLKVTVQSQENPPNQEAWA